MPTEATQLKLAGLERAASHHSVDLRRAQHIAEIIAIAGPITSDSVREAFEIHEGRPLKIGNAMGKLFSNRKKWESVGRVQSKRASSHARYLTQWQLKEAYRPAPQKFAVGIENGVRFCLTCNLETERCTCQPKG